MATFDHGRHKIYEQFFSHKLTKQISHLFKWNRKLWEIASDKRMKEKRYVTDRNRKPNKKRTRKGETERPRLNE